MKRRSFLLRGALQAGAATGLGGLFGYATKKPAEEDTSLQQTLDPSPDPKNSTFENLSIFAKTYDIKSPEKAKQLYEDVYDERVKFYAEAGAISSVIHTATTKLPLDDIGKYWPSIIRVLTTNVGIGATLDLSPLIRSNKLASSEYVEKTYGLTSKNAEQFCKDFKAACIKDMSGIGKAVAVGQEAFHFFKPPVKERDAPVIDFTLR